MHTSYPIKPNGRYWAYARKSTDREDLQVDSIPIQNQWFKKIEQYHNIKIERIFEERRSALIPDNRPEFKEMLKGVKSGKLDGIITISLDRAARNMIEGGLICHALQTKKIKHIITAHGIFDPTSDTISMSVHFAQATQYSRNLSYKTIEGQNYKTRNKGKWMWMAPTGYENTMDPKTREKFVVPDEHFEILQKIIRRVFRGMSIAEAYDKSYEMGLRSRITKKRQIAKKMTRSGFYNLFDESRLMFYAGMVRDLEGDWYKGEHKAMLTMEEVEEYLGRKNRRYIRSEKFFPFRSLVVCSGCGKTLTSQVQKGFIYYHCTGRGCEQKRYIREDRFSTQFKDLLGDFQISKNNIELMKERIVSYGEAKQHVVQEDNEIAFKKISDIEKEKVQLTRMRTREEISFEDFKKTLAQIEKEEKVFRDQIGKNQEITRSDMQSASNWVELLRRLSESYEEQNWKEKAYFLKVFGSNFILKDKKLLCERINRLFLPPKNIRNSRVVSHSAHRLNNIDEYIDYLFQNIEEVEKILRCISFSAP